MIKSLSSDAILPQIDRAASELRRGGIIALHHDGRPAALLLAAEYLDQEHLRSLWGGGKPPLLALSPRRAEALGLGDGDQMALLAHDGPADLEELKTLTDPLRTAALPPGWTILPPKPWATAAVALVKLAGLLPMALLAPTADHHPDLLQADSEAVLAFPRSAARSLKRVAEADVPLAGAEQCHIVAFRPADGGAEHLALIIGSPDPTRPVLARLHSACFTGDLLGSLRCDCGEQLAGAIARLNEAGGGVLLYLAQEGRGIGLVNKLRAYRLQDAGLDTLDANRQLGFEDDERLYLPAVQMLRELGIETVRLLTNNPSKIEALTRHGITVTERVAHNFPPNPHNARYLVTKQKRSGHLF